MIMLNGKRIDSTVGDALPIGTLSPFVGLVAPKGYLICMGQLVDKAKYPELWELCGDTFGPSTTTQFYLPDLRGVTIAGYKQGDSTFGTLGALIGGLTHTHTVPGVKHSHSISHTHGVPGVAHTHTINSHYHWLPQFDYGQGMGVLDTSRLHKRTSGITPPQDAGNWWFQKSGDTGVTSGGAQWGTADSGTLTSNSTTPSATTTNSQSTTTSGETTPNSTVSEAGSSIQPTAVMNWIIKASMLAVIESNIEDSLTSTSSTDALSAKQGKVLKDLVDTNNGLAFKKSAIKTVQKRLTTDVAGNGALGMSPGNEIILSIYQLGTDANCWVTLYCYNGIYFVHTGNWDGSAFSGTATFEIVYIDRNDL